MKYITYKQDILAIYNELIMKYKDSAQEIIFGKFSGNEISLTDKGRELSVEIYDNEKLNEFNVFTAEFKTPNLREKTTETHSLRCKLNEPIRDIIPDEYILTTTGGYLVLPSHGFVNNKLAIKRPNKSILEKQVSKLLG